MTFAATIVSVMIASPGDVPEAREATYKALNQWNDANALNRGIMLLPLRWETSAVPETGPHPQDVINSQLVARADIVIALFGSRIGAATARALSGTIEEIEGAHEAGKPTHVYFSDAPLPNDVDMQQLGALREFKAEFQQRGLYGSFTNAEELGMLVWQVIEADLSRLGIQRATDVSPSDDTAVVIRVQPRSESRPETDSRGRMRSKTSHWIDVSNESRTKDAEGFTVTSESGSLLLVDSGAPRTLHAAQMRSYGYLMTLGGDPDPRVTVRWNEGGEEHKKTFSL